MFQSFFIKAPFAIIALLFCIAFVFCNFLFGKINKRIDVTADRIYTLSDASKEMLRRPKDKIQVRFYLNNDENILPIELRNYAERVDAFIDNLERHSGGKLEVTRFDPQPDSDAEEAAKLDGITGQEVEQGVSAYMGLSLTCLDKNHTIPFLDPQREPMLEEDILRALDIVTRDETKKIGIYSSLPIFGSQAGSQPWAFIQMLADRYRLFDLSSGETNAAEMDLVMLIQARDVPSTLNEQLDQYLAAGKNVIVLADPVPISKVINGENLTSENASSASDNFLERLGIAFMHDKVVLDMTLKESVDRGEGPEILNCVLGFTDVGVNKKHPLSADVNALKFPAAGTFKIAENSQLVTTTLLSSSDEAKLHTASELYSLTKSTGEKLLKDFKSDKTRYPIASLIEGSFPLLSNKIEATERKPAKVIFISDTDFICDTFAGYFEVEQGQQMFVPSSGNMSFFMNTVDYMFNDNALSSVRGRSAKKRPLTKLVELKRNAEAQYLKKIEQLEKEEAELNKMLDAGNVATGLAASSKKLSTQNMSNVQESQARASEIRRELRLLRRELRLDVKGVESRLRWLNIAVMPAIAALIGIITLTIRTRHSRVKI